MLHVAISCTKTLTCFFASLLIFLVLHAEAQSLKDHLQKGDRSYQRKDYKSALPNYLEALSLEPHHAHANFRAGICFLNAERYSEAATHLEKAYQLQPEIDPNIDYHLAVAYQEDHQFSKALTHFGSFKDKFKSLSAVADQKIRECILADSLMKLPVHATVSPLDDLNTPFAESFPLLTPDGRNLIFTSNRSGDNYQIKSSTNFEDVYLTEMSGEKWDAPAKISSNINVSGNDAAVSLSSDGNTLFLYYEEGKGDIYTSTKENGVWSKPVALNRFVNHPQYRESGACLSPDGNKLYFSSNRPGGKGGYDIYVCERGSNGDWGRPSNLGSRINARGDEEFPFLDADGITLYFSSNSHPSIGNHDIFKSKLHDGQWTMPENLGYPINTRAYEGNFIVTQDRRTGYFASRRAGSADLYRVIFSSSPSIIPDDPEGTITPTEDKAVQP